MKFKLFREAVMVKVQKHEDEKRAKVNALVEKLTAIWGGDVDARIKAWNVATWRARRGLSLDVRKVLP